MTNNENDVQKNTIGLVGFIIALIAVFTEWIPVFGWIIWAVGALLSVIGLFKMPRGFAIAGTIISFFILIVLIILVILVGSAVGVSDALGGY